MCNVSVWVVYDAHTQEKTIPFKTESFARMCFVVACVEIPLLQHRGCPTVLVQVAASSFSQLNFEERIVTPPKFVRFLAAWYIMDGKTLSNTLSSYVLYNLECKPGCHQNVAVSNRANLE